MLFLYNFCKILDFARSSFLKKVFFVIPFFCVFVFSNAQDLEDFNILTDKAIQKLYTDPQECIRYTQSLLLTENNPENRIVLQKIISQAYTVQGNYVQAITMYNQRNIGADEKPENVTYFIKVFDNYNLADIYQNLMLYNQSEKIISQQLGNPILLKTQNGRLKTTIAKLYQLQAINSGIKRQFSPAINDIKKSDEYLNFRSKENDLLKKENSVFLSYFLVRSNRIKEAKTLLNDCISSLKQENGESFILSFAYQNLSTCYFQEREYQKAIDELDKGFHLIENLPYTEMKLIYYELFSKNYLALKNDEKYVHYNNLYNATKKQLDTNRKEGIQFSIQLLENQHKKEYAFEKQSLDEKQNYLIALVLITIIGLMVFSFYEMKMQRSQQKQILFLQNLEGTKIKISESSQEKEKIQKEKIQAKDLSNNSEKELEIQKKLAEWEETKEFLSKNMSISVLSAQTGINTKYLSEYINGFKRMNFNAYINELRITHVANLLKNDAAFLNYKVSYLAEYCGFSSHGAFTNVFKSITGMSPNSYIQQMIKSKSS